jgi:16S rRNA (guanine527-N7)-methyltransferase
MKWSGTDPSASGPGREPLPTCVNDLEELPPGYARIVSEGLGRLTAVELDEDQLVALADHIRLLLAWNRAINLTAIRDPEAAAREHVLDSLAAAPLLREAGIEEFADVGSGGGFPGLPLAIALPACRVLLVESIAKKARFLQTAASALALGDRVTVAGMRVETLAADPVQRGRWPAVVARAVAETAELAELTLPLLRVGGLLVAWKRRPFDEELDRTRRALGPLGGRVAEVRPVTVPGLEDHVLAVVEKLADTPVEFPRDPAARRRRPLGM